MKKVSKLFIVLFLTLVSMLILQTKSNANTINKIDMDVFIDNDGNAIVKEIWETNLTQGTEGYKSYNKLGNSTISNFSVSDDSGRTYDSLSYWNTSASFDNKAYKCGINYTSNGVELCWGISSYGSRTYILKYEISNFVTQYTDTQGIYFNFINLDQMVEEAKISIRSDLPFSLDNAKIWAFGNDGNISFEDGCILFDSNGILSSNQYMVALVRFENNIFNTSNNSNISFDEIYDSALSDTTDTTDTDYNVGTFTLLFLSLFAIIMNPLYWIIGFVILSKVKGKTWLGGSYRVSGELNFGKDGKELPKNRKIEYCREIPCDKDLLEAYWVCSEYNVVEEKTLEEGIIGAILLKWIKNDYITVSKTKKGLFSIKDNNYAIDFTKMKQGDNETENELLKMLKSAAGSNRILEAKEFSKWCKNNYSEFTSWFRHIEYNAKEDLEKKGLIIKRKEEIERVFGSKRIIIVNDVSSKLREEAIKMKGLKKFLLDYSMMPQKEYIEVHIWEEYLIFAQLLGIADKVEKQFSKLYPNLNQKTSLNTEITTIAIRNMAQICYESVQIGSHIARSKNRGSGSSSSSHDYSGSSRRSGGGGSSYSSGGSSSGGSSGGGFR